MVLFLCKYPGVALSCFNRHLSNIERLETTEGRMRECVSSWSIHSKYFLSPPISYPCSTHFFVKWHPRCLMRPVLTPFADFSRECIFPSPGFPLEIQPFGIFTVYDIKLCDIVGSPAPSPKE